MKKVIHVTESLTICFNHLGKTMGMSPRLSMLVRT